MEPYHLLPVFFALTVSGAFIALMLLRGDLGVVESEVPWTLRPLSAFALGFLAAVILIGIGEGFLFSSSPVVTAEEHLIATAGLALASFISFCVVILLSNRFGRLEFEAFGFRFSGGSGSVILWALCLVVLVAAMKALW